VVTTPAAFLAAQDAYPWLKGLNLPLDQVRDWLIEVGDDPNALLGKFRQTQQYKDRFAGIYRDDGTLRTTEAQYIQTESDLSQTLHDFGRPTDGWKPADYAAFFKQGITPQVLQQRLQVWDNVTRGPSDVRDAFYVYGGMRLSDEDLYTMAVDPAARQHLVSEYNSRVAKSPLDYQTWVTRATEAGLDRVTQQLESLQQQGVVTGDALASVRSINPQFAQQMVSALYQGNDPTLGRTLDLNELMHAFDFALIGGAATANGLALPTAERVEALREAGITRAKALDVYSSISQGQSALSGALSRSNLGQGFTQDDLEKALFLNSAPEAHLLAQAQSYDKSLAESSGSPGFSQDPQTGQLRQRGLSTTY
jgi:hypothetical protein